LFPENDTPAKKPAYGATAVSQMLTKSAVAKTVIKKHRVVFTLKKQ
jgi:hypothetical protein